jgi:lysophospholipase L1-like esterase
VAVLTAAAAVVGIDSARPAAAATPVRIMALGDSITGSPGCWRALLWQRLTNTGFTNIDFVGTLPPQGCGFSYDGENEGHGGFLATNVANQNQLVGWLSATRPDIVIMHFGTNDVWNNIAPATITAAFSRLVDQMRASNPAMKILVAKIIPMNPSNCPDCGQRVVNLNNAIPGWAAGKTTAQSPITVVDQWTGFSTSADTTDGVHPNSTTGIQKISDKWYPPLTAALNGFTNPPPTSNPPPPGGCAVTYAIANVWPGNFQAAVVVRNTGSTAISNGWTVTWTYTGNQTIYNAWGIQITQSGPNVTGRNVDWTRTIPVGGSVTAGIQGTVTTANAVPSPITCRVN